MTWRKGAPHRNDSNLNILFHWKRVMEKRTNWCLRKRSTFSPVNSNKTLFFNNKWAGGAWTDGSDSPKLLFQPGTVDLLKWQFSFLLGCDSLLPAASSEGFEVLFRFLLPWRWVRSKVELAYLIFLPGHSVCPFLGKAILTCCVKFWISISGKVSQDVSTFFSRFIVLSSFETLFQWARFIRSLLERSELPLRRSNSWC